MRAALRHVPSLFLKTSPLHLTFFVTRRCNARCPLCFYAAERDAEGGAPELSLDEIRRVARSMGKLLWVLFSGGEPFLRPDLPEIAGAFHDANGAGFLTVPTNGLMPELIADATEEILRRCPDGVVVVKLSLDGVGADHDAVRRVPGGFEKVLRTHERLAAVARRHPRLELGVNTLFCAENQWRLDGLLELVAGLDGVRSHTLTMVRGEPGAGVPAGVDLDQYRRVTARLEERWRGRFHRFAGSRLKAAQDRVQRQLVHATLLERRRLLPCYAGRLGIVLSERGEVAACEPRRREPLGNVRDVGYRVSEILRSARARGVLDDIAAEGCHCAHECNLLVNLLFNPAMYPRLAGEWARLRLGIPGRKDRAVVPSTTEAPGDDVPGDRRQLA
ncbi:MAG TPA: radical SAM protein [Vicinamibacteria bacterium]